MGVVGGVGGGDVGEDLFGVPVEEGGEVGFEVEGDVGVFFAFGAVVVWSAFDSVFGYISSARMMMVGGVYVIGSDSKQASSI